MSSSFCRSLLSRWVHKASDAIAAPTETILMARHFLSGSLITSAMMSGAATVSKCSRCPPLRAMFWDGGRPGDCPARPCNLRAADSGMSSNAPPVP